MEPEQPLQQTQEELKDLACKNIDPEFKSAVSNNTASFDQLMQVYYLRFEKFNDNKTDRLSYSDYFPLIQKAFEAKHGDVIKLYAPNDIALATVLTNKYELHWVYGQGTIETPDIKILDQICKTQIEIHRLLKDKDLETYMEWLYNLQTHLFGYLVEEATTGEKDRGDRYSSLTDYLWQELREIKKRHVRSAQRRARIEYFTGMLWGVLVVSVEVIAAGLFLTSFKVSGITLPAIPGILLAGGVGAIVSVMSRMSFGGLILDYEAGPLYLNRLGAFRPIIGSIMGLVLYVLILSGLLPIAVPEDVSSHLYFYLGISFIAGFTERWAQDMLVVAQDRITKKTDEEQQSNVDTIESPSTLSS